MSTHSSDILWKSSNDPSGSQGCIMHLHIPPTWFLASSTLPAAIFSFRTAFTDFNLHWTKWTLRLFVLVSSFSYFFLATCARLSWSVSFWVHVKLFYRIVSYRIIFHFQSQNILPSQHRFFLWFASCDRRLLSIAHSSVQKLLDSGVVYNTWFKMSSILEVYKAVINEYRNGTTQSKMVRKSKSLQQTTTYDDTTPRS